MVQVGRDLDLAEKPFGPDGRGKLRTKHLHHDSAIVPEILGLQIASLQNLAFYLWLMREARNAILEDRFLSWKNEVQPRVSRRL